MRIKEICCNNGKRMEVVKVCVHWRVWY